MKFVLSFLVCALSLPAFATDVLISFGEHDGFIRHPLIKALTISTDGSVVVEVREVSGGVIRNELTIQLAPTALQKLKRLIDGLPPEAKLVDLDANKPRCMDAPSQQIAVYTQGQQRVTYFWASCHASALENNAADELNSLVKSLVWLSL
jgi:hypothetical protein